MYIILLIVAIIFIPFPIKLGFTYINNKITVNIYNYKINIDREKKRKAKFKIKFEVNIKEYIQEIKHLHFKASMKTYMDINIGLDDAAKTAELFGFINYFIPVIYIELEKFFKIKKYDYKVTPNFKESIFEVKINSIIWISIVKAIYILVHMLLAMIKLHTGPKKINHNLFNFSR